jgi:hypothetical protein
VVTASLRGREDPLRAALKRQLQVAERHARVVLERRHQLAVAKTGAPATLAVIVGSGYGYTRDDGIAVVPIGALGP